MRVQGRNGRQDWDPSKYGCVAVLVTISFSPIKQGLRLAPFIFWSRHMLPTKTRNVHCLEKTPTAVDLCH